MYEDKTSPKFLKYTPFQVTKRDKNLKQSVIICIQTSTVQINLSRVGYIPVSIYEYMCTLLTAAWQNSKQVSCNMQNTCVSPKCN